MLSRVPMNGDGQQCVHHKGCNQRRQEEGWLTAFRIIGQYVQFGYGQWPPNTDMGYIKRQMANAATRMRRPVFLCQGGDWKNPLICMQMPHARRPKAQHIAAMVDKAKIRIKANEVDRPMNQLKSMMKDIDLSKCVR